jgi:hypothetical protein
VRGHEHHRGWIRERGQHTRQFETVESGHVDVEEHRVDGARPILDHPQGCRGVGGRHHLADRLLPPEQVGQLVEGGRLVVDSQHRQRSVPVRGQ